MRIKKFKTFEAVKEIDPNKITEITSLLTETISDLDKKREQMENLIKDLSIFKSGSKDNNDQIDDSIINLETIKKELSNLIQKVDNVNTTIQEYSDKGRQFLY